MNIIYRYEYYKSNLRTKNSKDIIEATLYLRQDFLEGLLTFKRYGGVRTHQDIMREYPHARPLGCLLYTSDAADE